MALENYVKFLRGTPAAYANLTEKDKDTLYFISEEKSNFGVLYLGSKLIAGGGQPETVTLNSLKDVTISELGLKANSLLVYSEEEKAWINKSLDEVLEVIVNEMTGATIDTDGKGGLVPAPKAGEQDYFLKGDGTWAKVVSETKVFEITVEGKETHTAAIARVVGETTINPGDIAIVKELIANEKYQYTAYIYDSEWKAMDGNYNAENVYFDEDLLTTSAIGVIELENGQATIPAAGKNLKELFTTMFVKEQNPETIDPSVIVTLTQAGNYEVGKKVSVDYSVTFEDGSYSYGPEPTGVTPITYTVSDGINSQSTQKGSFDELIVTDEMNYCLTATVAHTSGNVPVTNTGNDYVDGAIKEGNAVGYSGYIKGFRPFFYGMSNVTKADIVYNSAFIRGLENGGAYDGKKTLTFTAAELEGVKRFVIAIPSASITNLRTGISSAKITSSMNANALEFYKELETVVSVQGADGYTTTVPYKVWVYEPTSIATEEVHEVILK